MHKPSWHQMVVVDVLDEGLDPGTFSYLSLPHALGNTARIPINSCHKRVTKGARFGAFIIILYNHSFSACISSRCDDDNLPWL